MRVGLVSDTHGLLRPAALAFLAGSDHLVHAGDIGGADIVAALRAIAPLTVVRGNNDVGAWAGSIGEVERVVLAGIQLCVVHDIAGYRAAPGDRVVVTGHSHRPRVEEREGVLFVNPGSAGRRRFTLPVALGELLIDGGIARARIVELDG